MSQRVRQLNWNAEALAILLQRLYGPEKYESIDMREKLALLENILNYSNVFRIM